MKKKTITTASMRRNIQFFLAFLLSAFSVFANPGDDKEAEVVSKVNYVKDKGRLTSNLIPGDIQTLPVGLVKEVDGKYFIIAVDSARVTPQGGFFSAYAAVKLPNTDDVIAFAAKNISLRPNGLGGFSSDSRLMLVSEKIITINERVKLRLPANGQNYIQWDCNGFQSISLEGEFIFDTTMIKPDLEMDPTKSKVEATFKVQAAKGFNFLVSTSISPFKVAGLADMSFAVSDAWVDLSDVANPTDFYYPVDYPSYFGGDANLWRGFYLKALTVKLPKGISTSNGRASFTAHNVVIDEMGVSGFMGVRNLFDISSGSVDGWAFSIDTIGVQILQNRLVGGSFGGTINVPFMADDTLGYAAEMEQRNGELNFNFLVQTNNDHEYNMAWGGKLRLGAGSMVSVQKYNGKLTASALLHGSLTVNQDIASIDSLSFQNLEISTRSPYLHNGTFALSSSSTTAKQSRLAKFPISLSNIGFEILDGRACLKTTIALNLMNKEDKGFSATTSILVKAKMEETIVNADYKKHKWVYDGIDITSISLSASIGSMDLQGTLQFFGTQTPDPVYGKGFRGNIKLKFAPMKDYMQANVYFGSKDDGDGDYRYWQANLYIPSLKIPVVPPAVYISGILGGASYHMSRVSPNSNATYAALNTTSSTITPTADAAGIDNREGALEFKFVPNKNIGLGIMAGVTLICPKEEVLNGDITLGVEFNRYGGINQAYLKGGAYFLSGLNRVRKQSNSESEVTHSNDAPVFAYLDMVYDNPNNVFHASIKTYMNVSGMVRGANPNDYVGEAVIHADPKDWYIYIGRPSQMMGVNILDLVTVKSYFMMGSKIESMPPPPPQVTEILGSNWSAPTYYSNAMASTSNPGIGFGAHFRASFPYSDPYDRNKVFNMGPFFAKFDVGAGADLILTKFNGQVNCGGNIITPGIKGWYAAGQVYAYLQGAIGIKVRQKKFTIIDLAAAAILQARMPNPTYMKGAVGGRYSILGGLVKGQVRFKFTLGQDCAPVNSGSELDNIKVIESMKPDHSATQVSVFAKPAAGFNAALNTELPIIDDNGTLRTYKVVPVSITLINSATNASIAGTVEYNSTNDAVIYNTTSSLTGGTNFKFKVVVKWQEKLSGGWTDLSGETETKEYTFTTGAAPNTLPLENVDYSYPVARQYNFYKNETTTGYIQLKTGQPDVFATHDTYGDWAIRARFKAPDGSILETPVTYSSNRASFQLPTLQNNTSYTFSIVRKPIITEQNVAGRMATLDSFRIQSERVQYVSETTSLLNEMNDGFSMTNQTEMDSLNTVNRWNPVDSMQTNVATTSNQVTNTVSMAQEIVVYRISFRTSKFGTLAEKMQALTNEQEVLNTVSGNVTAIGKKYFTTESFDEVELFGRGNNDKPLIQLNASANNSWFNDKVNPLMYELYGFNSAVNIDWRNINDLKEPSISNSAPMKGVKVHNNMNGDGYSLTDELVNSGQARGKEEDIVFAYYLSYYCSKDFQELRNKAAAIYLSENAPSMSEGAIRLINEPGYTDLTSGEYQIKLNYMLPGSSTANSSNNFTIPFRLGQTSSWQATGTWRCAKNVNGNNTGYQEREERNIDPGSPSYNQIRWINVWQSCAACPKLATWQATGNLRCAKDGSGYQTGYQEREEKDMESCSSTYGQLRWVSNGQNTSVCPSTVPNWQATNATRCVLDYQSQNTGEEEKEEKDMNSNSSTYNQVRWVSMGVTGNCPPPQTTIYAQLVYENIYDTYDYTYADVVVKLYSDAYATSPYYPTQPLSVNYTRDQVDNYGSTMYGYGYNSAINCYSDYNMISYSESVYLDYHYYYNYATRYRYYLTWGSGYEIIYY
jgi:hypothetical protein